jgi:prepilin-type N-terminal cleavage/methylation domain-containing protein
MINHNLVKRSVGFTLVEMAIVLVILGFVLGALLLPLQAQRQQIAQVQTENTLENAKRALMGFAQSRGRLPCPATAASNGMELPLGGTTVAIPLCNQQAGFLPAATLGIQPADAQGFALDAWNNRIMYAVAQNSSAVIVNPA